MIHNSTSGVAASGQVPTGQGHDKSSMNKGIAVGAAGALIVAAVIGGASWFAFTRGEAVEQANRSGSPTTVIGEPNTLSQPLANAPSQAQLQPQAPVAIAPAPAPTLPAPVYQPAAPQAQAAPAPAPAPVRPAVRPAPVERVARAPQGRSGVVAAVREVNVKGDANGVGAAVGGVLGGLLGNQLGGGTGRTAMTVAGAVGGGLAGHEVQKRVNGTRMVDVTVEFNDGTTETYRQNTSRAYTQGEHVRVRNGVVTSDNG